MGNFGKDSVGLCFPCWIVYSVRVMLESQFAVCFLDFRFGRGRFNAENFVGIIRVLHGEFYCWWQLYSSLLWDNALWWFLALVSSEKWACKWALITLHHWTRVEKPSSFCLQKCEGYRLSDSQTRWENTLALSIVYPTLIFLLLLSLMMAAKK